MSSTYTDVTKHKWVEINGFTGNIDYFSGSASQINVTFEIIDNTRKGSYSIKLYNSDGSPDYIVNSNEYSSLKVDLNLGDKIFYQINLVNMRIRKLLVLQGEKTEETCEECNAYIPWLGNTCSHREDMTKYIGQMVRVRTSETNDWTEHELLAVLPEDIKLRYILRDFINNYTGWSYCALVPNKNQKEILR